VDKTESVSDRLRRDAAEHREAAIDLVEHAALLIKKSGESDKQIEKNGKFNEGKKTRRSDRNRLI
jgi:hypothetical protein